MQALTTFGFHSTVPLIDPDCAILKSQEDAKYFQCLKMRH